MGPASGPPHPPVDSFAQLIVRLNLVSVPLFVSLYDTTYHLSGVGRKGNVFIATRHRASRHKALWNRRKKSSFLVFPCFFQFVCPILFVAGRFFCFFFRHDLSGLGRKGGGGRRCTESITRQVAQYET